MVKSQPINIKQVARDALERSEAVLAHWLQDGKRQGSEYVARNPTRADSKPGSFSVNMDTGRWCDFATGDKGGDLVSLVAYLVGCKQSKAARQLAEFLGRDAGTSSCEPQGAAPKSRTTKAPKKASPAKPIIPIPAQVPPLPAAHPRHGKPSATWPYLNAKGQALFYILRFDPTKGRKQILPLTWGPNGWQWKGLPPLRPLYKLDKLATRLNAPVMICEGEKAADAAAKLFPKYVTTTSPNGSNAASKADWSPLAGRDVCVWPDEDEPGAAYADDVARLARKAGAKTVAALNPEFFAVNLTTGKPKTRKPSGGWDAADALKDGWASEKITERKKVYKLFMPVNPERDEPHADDKLPRFELREDGDPPGVYYLGMAYNKYSKNYEQTPPMWICSPLRITARTRDVNGESWGRLLEFSDPDGVLHQWAMPMTMLAGNGEALRSEQLRQGLLISSNNDARRRLTDYLQEARPNIHARCVQRTGWYNGTNIFVFPHHTLGDQTEPVLFQTDSLAGNPYRKSGTLKEWRGNVAAPCAGNSRLVFSVSCAFAAALLGPCEEDSGGFHLQGISSNGKTTALRVASSVWGGADYINRWRTTSNGLEATAVMHSDTLLVLDELAQVDPREAGECSYMLSNSAGKSRADRNGNARARATWRLLFLSAGESSLADHMAQAGKRTHAGQEIRMCDIPADAGVGLGVFEELHGYKDGHTFSRQLCEMAGSYYGIAGTAFIEAVIEHSAEISGLARQLRDQFIQESLPENAGGQARRAAARFALVAVAGEFATAHGITGWAAGEAEQAVHRCFADWLAGRGGAGNAEIASMLRQIKQFFELHGEARFSPWDRALDDHAPRTSNRAGFVRKSASSDLLTYYVLPEVFRCELCEGFDYHYVERVLVDRGWLTKDSEGRATRKVRLPGYGARATRCYVMEMENMEA